ncbi:hypothetical protein ACQ7CX_22645, partial [Chryseobacterium arthrosphaerae]|uniref:hypothetical protein n=1 Tax=Chryseobacterium arthrosphaerae TaxID=651561 RepID=UPI003D3482E7
RTQKLSPPAPMVLLTRESRPPPVFILFLKILYHNDKGFFFVLSLWEIMYPQRIFTHLLYNWYGSGFG